MVRDNLSKGRGDFLEAEDLRSYRSPEEFASVLKELKISPDEIKNLKELYAHQLRLAMIKNS